MAQQGKSRGKAYKVKTAQTYLFPEADSPLRPDVGTQPKFRKRKPQATYRYNSSLSPALDWDEQNLIRERGEALIRTILEAGSLEAAKAAAAELKSLSATHYPTVWEHLAGTRSSPFAPGEHGHIAVKVIDDRGNELIVVRKLEAEQDGA